MLCRATCVQFGRRCPAFLLELCKLPLLLPKLGILKQQTPQEEPPGAWLVLPLLMGLADLQA